MSFASKPSLVVAAAAAALFVGGASFAPAPAEAASVKCVGANACQGHSECATATSACKGQNACKGQGFIVTETERDCTKALNENQEKS